MPTVFRPTKLDLHNAKARAGLLPSHICLSLPAAFEPTEQVRHAHAAAKAFGGTTIFYAGSTNAAADAIADLKGYYAILNGTDYVIIDWVDHRRSVMWGLRADFATGNRLDDQAVEIPLDQITSLIV